jgi:pyrroline-5-carboxylate reductase
MTHTELHMKLGFIGIGKIASAVVEGLSTSEANGLDIFLSPRNEKDIAPCLIDAPAPCCARACDEMPSRGPR